MLKALTAKKSIHIKATAFLTLVLFVIFSALTTIGVSASSECTCEGCKCDAVCECALNSKEAAENPHSCCALFCKSSKATIQIDSPPVTIIESELIPELKPLSFHENITFDTGQQNLVVVKARMNN